LVGQQGCVTLVVTVFGVWMCASCVRTDYVRKFASQEILMDTEWEVG
jgi:hypothetical protein